MNWTGSCLCGAVKYEATEAPRQALCCHCRMCQKASGTVFGTFAVFRAAALRFTQGPPKLYSSSAWAERGFCDECGTPLTFQYVAGPSSKFISVAIGSLDHPEAVRPELHLGIESQIPWFRVDDDLPCSRTEDHPGFVAARAAAEEAHA